MSAELARRRALVARVLDVSPEPLHRPLGVRFAPLDGEAYLDAWSRLAGRARRGEGYAGATLYVHIPFCARVCSYCLLSSTRTPGKAPVEAYLGALRRQIDQLAPRVAGLTFRSLHVGGGTPTLLSEGQLDELLGALAVFGRAGGFQIGVEAHPATATAGRLAVLARHGVDRVSFGVESFTPEVLRQARRDDQTEGRVRAAVAAARAAGLSVNLDMLAGLPGETEESFARSMRLALELRPDSMSVNRFLAENSPLARLGYGPDHDEHRRADRMLLAADALIRELAPPRWPARPLDLPGYGTQYVWDGSARARGYFQDDMIGPASTLALGHGALGHVHGAMFTVAAGSHLDFVAALERGLPAPMLASPVSLRFEMAFYLADRACRGDLSLARFARLFGHPAGAVFGRELGHLAACGLLRVEGDRVSKPPRLDFQVTHLLAFLLRSSDELAADLAALAPADAALARHPALARPGHQARWLPPPASSPAPSRAPAAGPPMRGSSIQTPGAADPPGAVDPPRVADRLPTAVVPPRDAADAPSGAVDLLVRDEPDQALAAAVTAARAAGATRVSLWMPPGRLPALALAPGLVAAGLDELVVSGPAGGAWPAGLDELARALPGRVSALLPLGRGDRPDDAIAALASSGVAALLLDVAAGLSGDEAQRVEAAAAAHRLAVEVLGDGRPERAQYRAIRAELPPSLLWCRLAMRASQASRGAQRLAVVGSAGP